MTKFYPPIHELVSFEACARHGSFTQAADELAVTVSAVSKQLQSLENRLGAQLFRRTNGRATLTDAGQLLLARVRPALQLIESAAGEILSRSSNSSTLNLSVLPTFAIAWLIPRLPEFGAAHPGVKVNLRPHLRAFEPLPPEVDAAVRFGQGQWPGCRSDYLVGREVAAVCSPAWLRQRGTAVGPTAFLGETLLHHVMTPLAWSSWFAQAGIKSPEALPGPRLEQYTLLIQSAMAGMGVALVPAFFIQEELAASQLVEPFPVRVQAEAGYYLVWPENADTTPPLQQFHAWIRRAARIGSLPEA